MPFLPLALPFLHALDLLFGLFLLKLLIQLFSVSWFSQVFKISYLASFITIFPKALEFVSFSICFLTKSTTWSHRRPLFWTNVQIYCLPSSLFFSLPFSSCLSSQTYSFQTSTFEVLFICHMIKPLSNPSPSGPHFYLCLCNPSASTCSLQVVF